MDYYELLKTIKEAAMDSVKAAHLCNFIFGRVTTVIKDPSGEVINIIVEIDSKLKPEIENLVFGQALQKNSIEEGDELILLRQSGGQLYYVMDRREDNNVT